MIRRVGDDLEQASGGVLEVDALGPAVSVDLLFAVEARIGAVVLRRLLEPHEDLTQLCL